MSKCIVAHTNPGTDYPGYLNFTREDDGSVSVFARGNPTKYDGEYVCGYAADKGKPGRCTPGDDHCNNYCNMAPEKGPMKDAPLPCSHTKCGETIHLTLSAEAYAALVAEAAGVNRLREVLSACRARIKAQTDVGLISEDPENENPQHELQELLPDIDDALGATHSPDKGAVE